MSDLTLPNARSERDRLADRTDVLDRVGVLRTLPDDLHATTPMLAEFYGVDREVVWQAVRRNREELDADGYLVLKPTEVTDMLSVTPSELGLPNGTSQVALFPRRAVLRVGMLLRDSTVARKVRDYLLDAEHDAPARQVSEDEKLFEAFHILNGRVERLTAENYALTEKAAEDAPKVNYVELYVAEGDLIKFRTVAANNNVDEKWLRELLVERDWIYVETESRWSNSKECKEIRRRYSAYAHKRSYFRPVEVHEAPRFKGEVMHTLKVTPSGAEAIARLIKRTGGQVSLEVGA